MVDYFLRVALEEQGHLEGGGNRGLGDTSQIRPVACGKEPRADARTDHAERSCVTHLDAWMLADCVTEM